MDDSPLGTIDLHGSNRLVFTVSHWKGRQYAHIRKFVASAKYSGPTKSGLALPGDVLVRIIDELERLEAEVPGAEELEFTRVAKRNDVKLVITIIPPDDLGSLPSVDLREHIETPGYSGPTKKGIRFPWDKLADVIGLLKTQAIQMGDEETQQRTLFPETAPEWVERAKDTAAAEGGAKPMGRDAIVASLLPEGPKQFPEEFLTDTGGNTNEISVPSELLEVVQQPDGEYVVRSDFGYRYPVRNEIEGKYIIYAQLRGQRTIPLPQPMIAVFKTVKAYENYVRDLRHALLQAYERKSGYRPVAEHQAKEAFKKIGLPWLDS